MCLTTCMENCWLELNKTDVSHSVLIAPAPGQVLLRTTASKGMKTWCLWTWQEFGQWSLWISWQWSQPYDDKYQQNVCLWLRFLRTPPVARWSRSRACRRRRCSLIPTKNWEGKLMFKPTRILRTSTAASRTSWRPTSRSSSTSTTSSYCWTRMPAGNYRELPWEPRRSILIVSKWNFCIVYVLTILL